MRRRTTTFLAIGVMTAIVAPLAFAQAVPDYRKLILKSGKQSVAATLGYRCVPTPAGNDCPSTGQPAPPYKTTGTMKVKAGDQITLLFGAPVGDVNWWTARVNGLGKEAVTAKGTAKIVSKKVKKRWRITLPKNLRKSSTILAVYALSPNAQALFEVGLKVR